MKCNLIVPGFAKSGTSSMHKYLDLHPEICMSAIKEPHFFSRDDKYRLGHDWHDSLFDHASSSVRFFGESSTTYSLDEKPLHRIKSDTNGTKLIVLLRDPVERLLSHYKWLWALNLEQRPLLNAVNEEEKKGYDVHKDISGCYPAYLQASRYSVFVPLMKSIFGEENVLCLASKMLLEDPELSMKKCFDFLNIPPVSIENKITENRTIDKGIQRTFGINYIAKFIPQSVRERNFYRLSSLSVQRVLGKKRKKPPVIKEDDVKCIKEMLVRDIDYFHAIITSQQ